MADADLDAQRRRLPLLWAATLANFTALGIFFVAIPLYVSRELDGSKAAVGLCIGVFSISAVLFRPVVGRGIDQRGRKPFLVFSLVVLTATSLSFHLATAVIVVVIIRLVQGLGGAAYYTTCAAVTTDLAPVERRASAIAVLSLFLYGGFAAGPAVGEWLIDQGGFGTAWTTIAALAAAGLVAVLLLPETGGAAIAQRAELGPSPHKFLHPAAIGPGLVLTSTAVGYTSITAFSALYAREVGLSSSGALYAVFAFSIIAVRLVVIGGISDRLGHLTVAVPGVTISVLGLTLMAAFDSPAPAFAGVALYGTGFALVFPSLMAFTVDRVPDHERGEALGSFTAFMDIGSGGGGYLVGYIADHAGFHWAYATPAFMCAAGLVLLVVMARRDRRAGHHHEGPVPVAAELN